MKARLVFHVKNVDNHGNIVEMKIWKVKKTEDRPHGLKYSLVYIEKGERIVGYDNSEGKGDHRHYFDQSSHIHLRAWTSSLRTFLKTLKRQREVNYESKKC